MGKLCETEDVSGDCRSLPAGREGRRRDLREEGGVCREGDCCRLCGWAAAAAAGRRGGGRC